MAEVSSIRSLSVIRGDLCCGSLNRITVLSLLLKECRRISYSRTGNIYGMVDLGNGVVLAASMGLFQIDYEGKLDTSDFAIQSKLVTLNFFYKFQMINPNQLELLIRCTVSHTETQVVTL